MVNKIKRYLKNEELVYKVFTIFIITTVLLETSFGIVIIPLNYIIRTIRYICYVYFLFKFFMDWKNKKNNITLSMIIFVILSAIAFLFSRKKEIVVLLLLLIPLRYANKDRLIRITFYVNCIVFFTVIFGALLKIFPNWTYMRNDTTRYSLGFIYPTITIGLYLFIVMMYTYIKRSNISIYEIIAMEIINIFLYIKTDGRTSFILITLILLAVGLIKIRKVKQFFFKDCVQKILKYLCYTLPLILLIFILGSVALYGCNSNIAYSLDEILSNRIELSYKALEKHNLTLFGQDIEWNGWGGYGYVDTINEEEFDYNYVDNAYIRTALDYGIIITTLVLGAYTIMLTKCYNEKNYWLLFELIIILILSEIEPCLINIERNIFLLTFTPLLNFKELKIDNIFRKHKKLWSKTK